MKCIILFKIYAFQVPDNKFHFSHPFFFNYVRRFVCKIVWNAKIFLISTN
jgi:hypothetical protein